MWVAVLKALCVWMALLLKALYVGGSVEGFMCVDGIIVKGSLCGWQC